jgi:hypothetical protein
MKGIPIFRLKRLERTAILLGAATLLAGASLLGATQAHAAIGIQPGALTLNPASAPTSTTGITYRTSTPCPAGHNGSGRVVLVNPVTRTLSQMAPNNNAVTAPFSGTFNATFALAASVNPAIVGATSEIVVQCFAGASGQGAAVAVQHTFVTINAVGHSYSTSSSGGTTATTSTPTSTESAAPTGGGTIPIGVTVTSATPAAGPATGGGTGPGSNPALAATGAAVVLAGGGLILLARQRRRQGAG